MIEDLEHPNLIVICMVCLLIGGLMGAVMQKSNAKVEIDYDKAIKKVESYLAFDKDAPNSYRAYLDENMTIRQVRGLYHSVPMAKFMVKRELENLCNGR